MPEETPPLTGGKGLNWLRNRVTTRSQELREAERVAELRRLHLERLAAMLSQGKFESRAADEVVAEAALRGDVPELLDRRRQVNIALQFVEAARQKIDGNQTAFNQFHAIVRREGGFLQTDGYGYDDLLARVSSPLWVVSHARGRVLDPRTHELRPSVWAADAQIELPADDAVEPLTFVPTMAANQAAFFPQNAEAAQRAAADILADPASAAVLEDVSVAPYQPDITDETRYPVADYRGRKFASVATNHALGRIAELNADRRHPIRYLLANMFSVSSVRLADGREVPFEDPVANEISILVHSLGSAYRRCFLAWESPQTEIAVSDGSVIRAGWWTAVRILGR